MTRFAFRNVQRIATGRKDAWNRRLGAFKHTAKALDVLACANSLANRVSRLPIACDTDFPALIDHVPIALQITSA